ncbi:MAG: hypothetical protein E7222_13920 [Clostridiales bacterium]|uniref:aspartate-alanine antiporter-like transporter n=1 Tax=Aminipila sp. TaxID=2060095 RepID=UPI001D4C9950|nr:hypothetical protein [Aminipila sp.]MBE6035775.1 hypothetical protein [Clostridiales bacterium]
MQFDIIGFIMNPFVLMFTAIGTGLLFGKIKFGKFSFGSSGTLFTGLLIGWAVYGYAEKLLAQGELSYGYEAASKLMSNGVIHSYFLDASLIFFVAAVGLLAAKDMGAVLKKYGLKFIFLGFLITFVGASATFGAIALLDDANSYELSGVYVGALTSSPGLGAALETSSSHAAEVVNQYMTADESVKNTILSVIDPSGGLTSANTPSLNAEQMKAYVTNAQADVGVGYAISYPFGVIIVIFAVNFFSSIFRMDVEEEKRRYAAEMEEARGMVASKNLTTAPFHMIPFSITCALGYLLGSIQINLGPLGYFSLGATGGILIMGLLLGYIGTIGPLSFRMDPKILSIIREIGLVFFLCIVGLKYGFRALDSIMGSGLLLAVSAVVIGNIAMLVGFLVGRYIFKLNWVMLAGAICGGMTSTPGLGAAIDTLDSDDPAAGYGATYPFALLGMIIFTILLNKLPLV